MSAKPEPPDVEPNARAPGDRAIALLKTLLEHGAWYWSAIELDTHDADDVDGERYGEEARAILADAGVAIEGRHRRPRR